MFPFLAIFTDTWTAQAKDSLCTPASNEFALNANIQWLRFIGMCMLQAWNNYHLHTQHRMQFRDKRCTLRNLQLIDCCPSITTVSYEHYSKVIFSTVFNMRKLCQWGLFRLAMDNIITNVWRIWRATQSCNLCSDPSALGWI